MLRNAMEWGNSLKREYLVRVGCLVLSDRVIFKVQDEGKGFDVAGAFDPIRDPIERMTDRQERGKRPGGYGIELARQYMDELFYNEAGNCVIMTKMI
ncbi:MAG: ATP-binding protein [Planctomycetota bacterium]|jgi:anti-sigma regulatory factor (Ser/Thr protein kinase)